MWVWLEIIDSNLSAVNLMINLEFEMVYGLGICHMTKGETSGGGTGKVVGFVGRHLNWAFGRSCGSLLP